MAGLTAVFEGVCSYAKATPSKDGQRIFYTVNIDLGSESIRLNAAHDCSDAIGYEVRCQVDNMQAVRGNFRQYNKRNGSWEVVEKVCFLPGFNSQLSKLKKLRPIQVLEADFVGSDWDQPSEVEPKKKYDLPLPGALPSKK